MKEAHEGLSMINWCAVENNLETMVLCYIWITLAPRAPQRRSTNTRKRFLRKGSLAVPLFGRKRPIVSKLGTKMLLFVS